MPKSVISVRCLAAGSLLLALVGAVVACGASKLSSGGDVTDTDGDAGASGDDGSGTNVLLADGGMSNGGAVGNLGDAAVVYAPFDAAVVARKQISTMVADSLVIAPTSGALEAWGSFGYRVPEAYVQNNPDGGRDSVPVDPPSPTPRSFVDGGTGMWRDVGGDCAVQTNNTLWCWGTRAESKYVEYGGTVAGMGGGGTYEAIASNDAPGALGGQWLSVTTNLVVACGIKVDGSGWCWGQDEDGTRGYAADADAAAEPDPNLPTPIASAPGTQWRALSAGWRHVCGVQMNGTLWCWGSNANGQLGLNLTGPVSAPVRVGTSSAWDGVSAGTYTSCASRGRDVYCWGNTEPSGVEIVSSHPDLPFGAALFATNPHGWAHVSIDGMGTCAVDNDGALWCSDVIQPGAKVLTDLSWRDVAVNGLHTCALATTGLVRCWGDNYVGCNGPNGGAIEMSELAETMTGSIPLAVDVAVF